MDWADSEFGTRADFPPAQSHLSSPKQAWDWINVANSVLTSVQFSLGANYVVHVGISLFWY